MIIGLVGWRLTLSSGSSSSKPIYTTATVKQGDVSLQATETGTLQPYQSTPVRALVQGTPTSAIPTVGENVKRGQVLLTMTDPTLTTKLKQDHLNIAKLQLQLQDAAPNSVSPSLQQQIDNTQIQLAHDQATLASDQALLNSQTVTAPSAGTVESISATVGQNVNANQQLVTITTAQTLQLSGDTVGNIDGLTVGTPAVVTLSNGQKTTGIVTSFSTTSQRVGQANGYPVTIEVKNPGFINDGEYATAWVKTDTANFTLQAYLQADHSVQVTAPLSGTVTKLSAGVGDIVNKGDPLLTLDSTSGQKQVTSDQIAIGNDQRQLQSDLAQENQTKVSNQQSYALLQNSLAAAQLSLQTDLTTQDELSVSSPVAGVIINVPINSSSLITPGTDIADVADLSKLLLTVPVDQSEINSMNVGDSVSVTSTGVPGQTFSGKVTSISLIGSNSNGLTTFPVTVTIDSPGKLKPGMAATAVFTVKQVKNALYIPNTAVLTLNGRSFVSVLRNGSPTRVPIQTGIVNANVTQVTRGLTAGESIVTSGGQIDTTTNNLQNGRGLFRLGGGGRPPGGRGGGGGGKGRPGGG